MYRHIDNAIIGTLWICGAISIEEAQKLATALPLWKGPDSPGEFIYQVEQILNRKLGGRPWKNDAEKSS